MKHRYRQLSLNERRGGERPSQRRVIEICAMLKTLQPGFDDHFRGKFHPGGEQSTGGFAATLIMTESDQPC